MGPPNRLATSRQGEAINDQHPPDHGVHLIVALSLGVATQGSRLIVRGIRFVVEHSDPVRYQKLKGCVFP